MLADILVGGIILQCVLIGTVLYVPFRKLVELLGRLVQRPPPEGSLRRQMQTLRQAEQPGRDSTATGIDTTQANGEQLRYYKGRGYIPSMTGKLALISLPDATVIARHYQLRDDALQQMVQAVPAVQQPMAVPASAQGTVPSTDASTAAASAAAAAVAPGTAHAQFMAAATWQPSTQVHPGMAPVHHSHNQLSLYGIPPAQPTVCQPDLVAGALSWPSQSSRVPPAFTALPAGTDGRAAVMAVPPCNLPAVVYSQAQLSQRRYGLARGCPAGVDVERQMQWMRRWLTDDINLSRPDELRRLADTTWETVEANILR